MKKEIKFRAWNPDDNKMEYPLVFAICDDDLFKPLIRFKNGTASYKDYPLMQSTGVKDKNGKEIYEGDIISFEDDPVDVVRWNEDFCCWTCWENGKINEYAELFDWMQMKKEDSKHYIIHGNIYENPELLIK